MLDTLSTIQPSNAGLLQYARKLERRSVLAPTDKEALLRLPAELRTFGPGETVIAEGSPATHSVLLESGTLSRQKRLAEGVCQILAVHIPGDAVDLQSILFSDSDHNIKSHGASRTWWIPHDDILRLCADHPALWRAIWLDTLVDAAIFREWTANIGQRNAQRRIAHLALELGARFEAVGKLTDGKFELPLTQQDLARALGLSLVHLNKSLRSLREAGLFEIRGRVVTLVDRAKLAAFSGFDSDYLHLDGRRVRDLDV